MFGKKILVLVPHPDDEVVACFETIRMARAAGSQVYALYLTNGCIAKNTLWPWQRWRYERNVARRRTEAEEVARELHITSAGRNSRPARYLWRNLPHVMADVKDAISAHAIDQLWLPAYEGGNPDHDGLNAIGQKFKPSLKVLEFAEYNFHGKTAHSNHFPHPNGTEIIIKLDPNAQAAKLRALQLYASEKSNLNYIGTEQEAFRPLADYDYSKPPHEGTLWYERFQWVPFRHPRVDFTKPAEVSQAITEFLGTGR